MFISKTRLPNDTNKVRGFLMWCRGARCGFVTSAWQCRTWSECIASIQTKGQQKQQHDCKHCTFFLPIGPVTVLSMHSCMRKKGASGRKRSKPKETGPQTGSFLLSLTFAASSRYLHSQVALRKQGRWWANSLLGKRWPKCLEKHPAMISMRGGHLIH